MTRVAVSAPGKLFITGEYAVLERAPALLSAIDVRATCTLQSSDSTVSRIVTPPLVSMPSIFRFEENGIAWDGKRVGLFDAAWSALDAGRRERIREGAWNVSLDTTAFFIKDRKLGLGSSAAALAALMGALWAASGGMPAEAEAFETLHAAHSAWQGAGSGADLAVALAGGTVLYRREPRVAAPVSLPGDVEILPVWTGRLASTGDFLRRLAEFREASPNGYQQCLAVLQAKAEEAGLAASAGSAKGFIAAFRACADALRALGEAANLDIWSAAHREIAAAVESAGGAYKPSGAGGGDIGLAIVRVGDVGAAERVKSSLSSTGYRVLPLRFGARGLNVSSIADD